MAVFAYGAKEIEHLRKKDKKLGLAIDRIGQIRRHGGDAKPPATS